MNSRNKGRSQRKRIAAIEEAAVEEMDEHSNNLLAQIADGYESATSVVERIAALTGAEAQRLMLSLRRVQCYQLSKYASKLKTLSTRLGAMGCWSYRRIVRGEAIRFGIDEELQHLTFQNAAEFADRRMAKLTRTYSKGK